MVLMDLLQTSEFNFPLCLIKFSLLNFSKHLMSWIFVHWHVLIHPTIDSTQVLYEWDNNQARWPDHQKCLYDALNSSFPLYSRLINKGMILCTSERSTSPILIQISFCLQFSLSFISPVKDQTNLLIRKHSLSSALLHMDCLQANDKGIVLPSIWSGSQPIFILFRWKFHSSSR